MTIQECTTTMISVGQNVLETQVFMFGDLFDKGEFDCLETDFIMASVSFDGPVNGQCFWVAPVSFCVELAANMLGVSNDDDLALSGTMDALSELANVTCCQFLTTAFGTQPLFHLHCPVATSLDTQGWKMQIADSNTQGVSVDGYSVLIGLAFS